MLSSRSFGILVFIGVIGLGSAVEAQVGGWVSANAMFAQPAETSTTQTDSFPYRSETFTDSVTYPSKGHASVDVGGGVRLFRQFGLGIAVSSVSDSQFATINFSVPHPRLFLQPASASGPTSSPLKQQETVVHVEASYIANMPHVSVTVFGGPSYFNVTREIVTDFSYNELLLTNNAYSVSLTGDKTRSATMTAWGVNVGADVGYFFTEHAGVGGLVRFSRAKVNLPNELRSPAITESLNVGGLSVGGGFRLRF